MATTDELRTAAERLAANPCRVGPTPCDPPTDCRQCAGAVVAAAWLAEHPVDDNGAATAREVVRRVNAHDALVAALTAYLEAGDDDTFETRHARRLAALKALRAATITHEGRA